MDKEDRKEILTGEPRTIKLPHEEIKEYIKEQFNLLINGTSPCHIKGEERYEIHINVCKR